MNTREQVLANLDALIADVKASTGRDKVDVLGHSLGTTLMHEYLATPERAANVRKYVNIDGRTAATPPGGVPTLAVWAGRGTAGREITGAENVTIPNQTHVQVATSAESFAPMYRFFTGHRARRDIAPERWITLSGRAQLFPQNTGVGDRTLEVWKVSGRTGQRRGNRPLARVDIADDGSWGPVRGIRAGAHYEFALLKEGQNTHHLYFEPFVRSSHLVRLLTSEPNGGVNLLIARSPAHSAFTIVRYKELWGDQGAENDELFVNGTNVINAATAPITKRVIGMFAFDAGSDKVSNVTAPLRCRLLAAVPERRGSVRPGDGSRQGDKLGGAPVTWRWAVASRQRPRLPLQHRLDLREPERLRPCAPAPPSVALAHVAWPRRAGGRLPRYVPDDSGRGWSL